MMTLYTLTGSCSMAPHILLHELGQPHSIEVVDLRNASDEFKKINPRGQVPALLAEGQILTEQLGIDTYLASLRPELGLLPEAPLDRARVYEALGYANSSVHPAVGHIYFPQRYVGEDETAKAQFVDGAKTRFVNSLTELELLIEGPYLLGERFSAADAYLFVMYRWAVGGGVDMAALPKLSALGEAMLGRASVKKMLIAEGLA